MSEPVLPPKDPLTEPGPWNAVAAGYDEAFFKQLPSLIDDVVAALDAPEDGTVLDVATGPGTLAVKLATRVKHVVAVDFAAEMVERLRSHLFRGGIGNVETHVMDGHALGFPEASFDAVVSMFGVFLFADRAKGMSEMFRVVRPGGRGLFTSWMPAEQNTMIGAGMEALRAALPNMPRPSGPLPTQSPEICAQELAAAGFTDVTSRVVTIPVTQPTVSDYFLSFQRAAAPLVVLRRRLGDAAFATAMEATFAHLRERFGTGPVELEAAVIVTSGVR